MLVMPSMKIVKYLLIDFLIDFFVMLCVNIYFPDHSVINQQIFLLGDYSVSVNIKFLLSQGFYLILLWCPFISLFEAHLKSINFFH